MTELLTTKQLTEILQVDRTTIYRMADQGRIPGVKVGNQWRFPRSQIESWLQSHGFAFGQAPVQVQRSNQFTLSADIELRELLPLECIEQILDGFTELLGIMGVVTDLQGHAITPPSNPCGYFLAVDQSPIAHKRCLQHWTKMAKAPSLMPRFQPSYLGLLCARGFIRVDTEIRGMVILGGIAPTNWPPTDQEMQIIADDLGVDVSLIKQHAHEVHRLSAEEQKRALPYVQRIADIITHIATERMRRHTQLQKIIAIAQEA